MRSEKYFYGQFACTVPVYICISCSKKLLTSVFWSLTRIRTEIFQPATGAGLVIRSCTFGSELDSDPKIDHSVHMWSGHPTFLLKGKSRTFLDQMFVTASLLCRAVEILL